jgi:AhpD family alkylhydroperoxidase
MRPGLCEYVATAMIKHVRPVSRSAANGDTARIYEQMTREFGIHAEPIVLHSPAPELLAGAWSVCRETLVAGGSVDRATKEAVATAVSSINRCPFCVDAHAVMLAGTGNYETARLIDQGDYAAIGDPRLRRVVEWAAATRSPGSSILREPPFEGDQAPELIGTAVLFHYINRPVTVFLDDSPLPWNGRLLKGGMLRIGGRRFRELARSSPEAGATLDLLPLAELPEDLRWAEGSAPLAGAWARFAAAVERAGELSLPFEARARVLARLREWKGEPQPLGSEWLEQGLVALSEEHRAGGRLALLSALAPYRVDEGVISSYRETVADDDRSADERIVGAVAWGALAAARRVGSWLQAPLPVS